jgi:hypothetical protein
MHEPSTVLNAASGSEKPSLLQNVRLLSLGRLLALCFFLGVGIGVGVVGTSSAMKWYGRRPLRPIPAKDWPPVSLSVGATARLKSDWNGEARYQLSISPITPEAGPALRRIFRLVEVSPTIAQFTIHFYDKAGFEVSGTDVEMTPIQNSDNAVVALTANGHFYCSRSDYNQQDRWNIDYRFPVTACGGRTRKVCRDETFNGRESLTAQPANHAPGG